jgi:cytochrome c oxidase assembly protein subunit 11
MSMSRNTRLALRLGAVVVLMVGLSFAAVPFYDWFCRTTGFGGTTATAVAPSSGIVERTIEVRFDANTAPDMPWEFRPVHRTMQIRLGETGLAEFEAYNPTDAVVAGSASYNVAPYAAGGYFTMIACFCFEMQVLGPGVRVTMPVTFYVDPSMLEDTEARHLNAVTLSYTMHRAEVPEAELAAAPGSTATIAQ